MLPYIDALLLAFFVAASAFFAAAEVSFLSLSAVRLHSLIEKKAPGAECLARLRRSKRRVVVSLLIGSNLANVGASALATSIAISIFGEAGLGVAVGVASFLLLTLGDIAPKSAATNHGERIALAIGPLIEMFYVASYPLVLFFEGINRLIPGVYARATTIEKFTEEEVRAAVRLGAQDQGISDREREIIENVLAFKDRRVEQAMTPRAAVDTLPVGMRAGEAHAVALRKAYSRFPVVRGSEVVGTLSVKMLGRAALDDPDQPIEAVMFRPILVGRHEKVSDAFQTLQRLGRNIAVVVDERGRMEGVVTLEDLLEELVGEIK